MLVLLIISLFYPFAFVVPKSLPYAEWAHYHMIWLHDSHTNQIDIQNMFNDYINNNIQFGIVNIDAGWTTDISTFVFDPKKFPTVRNMLDGFREKNVRIVLWMTSMINTDSPNYQYAQEHGYLFNKTIKWWCGQGRLLNYFNVEAVNWWHSLIKQLIDTVGPIHAFKADGTDPYIIEVLDPLVTWERYRTAYYNDTFQVLRQLVGPDALVMSRPVDAYVDYSPRDIVFIGWVGDEDGTYDGLKTALHYMLESGRRGYVGFGSDIGGYRTDSTAGKLGRTKELFLRWTAIGALSSFMENGGGGEHLPWNFDNETADIYRSWVNLHYKLVPYLYSEGTKVAIEQNGTLMRPCDDIEALLSHSYFLGPNIYVVPVLQDPTPGQTQRLWLPKSSTNQWINYFNTSIAHKSHTFINEDTSSLYRIPIYIEQNSLIPMYDIEKNYSLNALKFVLWGKIISDKQQTTLFTRDGQQWLLEFNRFQRQLTVHFIQQYDSNEKHEWIWKFCQYVNQQEICTHTWLSLHDNASVKLEFLV
ncbi:unnamed protein product [Rotaria magnacalcarata]|uniref:Uncharacterized protein n=5 Tax=Rotaria magnacalcarata TaxID=392030 RepID=A0A815JG42_9BILA|nr:unnamed protein product [Rotaria magnacalcarata]CAF3973727.1 unnamed protein product [Rotaria magnacalcarata]